MLRAMACRRGDLRDRTTRRDDAIIQAFSIRISTCFKFDRCEFNHDEWWKRVKLITIAYHCRRATIWAGVFQSNNVGALGFAPWEPHTAVLIALAMCILHRCTNDIKPFSADERRRRHDQDRLHNAMECMIHCIYNADQIIFFERYIYIKNTNTNTNTIR